MPRTILVVFSQPTGADQDEDYNRWYDDVHLGEVLAVPGLEAATRFRASEFQIKGMEPARRYMSVYELDGDPRQAISNLFAAAKDMNLSDALDRETAQAYVFEEVTARRTDELSEHVDQETRRQGGGPQGTGREGVRR